MIWIIAGTTEGREIIDRIKDLDNYIATVATDGGKEFIDSENLLVARMDYDEMLKFCKEHKISLIVDMTHPYARIVTENAKNIAEELGIEYIRYRRDKTDKVQNAVYLYSYEEAYEYLSNIEGRVFFTTGSKNIKDFEKIKGNNRFIYRVLPALDSIEECKKHNISMHDIIAILGPFSKEYNKIMFREYKVNYVIMKDSGEKGGTLEKIQACEELNITPIIIGRKDEEGINNLDEIEQIIRRKS